MYVVCPHTGTHSSEIAALRIGSSTVTSFDNDGEESITTSGLTWTMKEKPNDWVWPSFDLMEKKLELEESIGTIWDGGKWQSAIAFANQRRQISFMARKDQTAPAVAVLLDGGGDIFFVRSSPETSPDPLVQEICAQLMSDERSVLEASQEIAN